MPEFSPISESRLLRGRTGPVAMLDRSTGFLVLPFHMAGVAVLWKLARRGPLSLPLRPHFPR